MILNEKGSYTILVLIFTAMVALVGMGILDQVQNGRNALTKLEEQARLRDIRADIEQLLSDSFQCSKNFAPIVSYPMAQNISALSFAIPSLGFFGSAGNELLKVAAITDGRVSSMTLQNLSKVNPAGTQVTGSLVVKWNQGPLHLARNDVVLPNFNLSMSDNSGTAKLTGCSLGNLPSVSSYKGKEIGTTMGFSKTWTTHMDAGTQTQIYTVALSSYPAARMVDVSSVCTVNSDDSGTGVDLVIRNGSVPLMRLNICYLWGIASKAQTFEAGQFFELPSMATDLDVVIISDAGSDGGGDNWYGEADLTFYE